MSGYEIRSAEREREPFDDYEYEIFRDGWKVAEFRHDFRSEDPMVRTTTSSWTPTSFAFLIGGGPRPLEVGPEGVDWLDRNLPKPSGG